jgi:hypothetical protein
MGAAITDNELDVHAPSHAMRYVGIFLAVLALGGAVWAFNAYTGKQDQSKLLGFDAFRAAYAEKCGVPNYADPQPEVIRDAYLSTPAIQAEMARQLNALTNTASCSDVVGALKKVDFAVPVATP